MHPDHRRDGGRTFPGWALTTDWNTTGRLPLSFHGGGGCRGGVSDGDVIFTSRYIRVGWKSRCKVCLMM